MYVQNKRYLPSYYETLGLSGWPTLVWQWAFLGKSTQLYSISISFHHLTMWTRYESWAAFGSLEKWVAPRPKSRDSVSMKIKKHSWESYYRWELKRRLYAILSLFLKQTSTVFCIFKVHHRTILLRARQTHYALLGPNSRAICINWIILCWKAPSSSQISDLQTFPLKFRAWNRLSFLPH